MVMQPSLGFHCPLLTRLVDHYSVFNEGNVCLVEGGEGCVKPPLVLPVRHLRRPTMPNEQINQNDALKYGVGVL
jgi:hypothetical protein